MIYLDNAATTLQKPACVAQAMLKAMGTLGNCARGAYGASLGAARTVYTVREQLARLFGCPRADHVIFTQNSTHALNIALSGLFSPGDHIITTDCEHNSVLRPVFRLQAQGVQASFVPADRQGRLDYDAFARLIRPNTRAIVCVHASNLTGNLFDIERIGRIAHEHGLLFVVDASQTAGVFGLDMARQHIDVVCFTGHKSLYGPQGTGGMCVRPGVEIRPFAVGGTGVQTYLPTQPAQYPTRLEAGTLNGHGIAGLGAALSWLEETGMANICAHEQALLRRFYDGVRKIPGVTVYGDWDTWPRAPVCALNIRGLDSGEVADALAEDFDIAVRPGAHCAPRLHMALGTKDTGAVRFSFGFFNTEDETDTAIGAVERIAEP
ncbi:MAG: aminotransferase class V-fold PLP-dependent enzyme [Oscillospiraceae bacterium]